MCLRTIQSDGGIQFDTGGTGNASGTNGTVNNISITIGSNSNRILMVIVSVGNSNGAFSITYNGTSPSSTLVNGVAVAAGVQQWIYLWDAPSTGTHNLAITIGNNNGLTYNVAYRSLFNVSQSAQPSQTSTPLPGSPSSAATITTATAGSMVIMCASGAGGSLSATNPINAQLNSVSYMAWSDIALPQGTWSISRSSGASAVAAFEFQPAKSVTGYGVGLASSASTNFRNFPTVP